MTSRAKVPFAFLVAGASLVTMTACDGAPSTLDARGPAADRIATLWWLLLVIATVVFAVVVGFLLVAIARARRRDSPVRRDAGWGERFIVIAGVVVPALILIAVFVVSLRDMVALSDRGNEADLTIVVIAHDWWWEVRYPNGAVTANEIHMPAGEPVRFQLLTDDVIHSFWVPQLQGKVDHITGRENYIWLEADEPGRYRGQCAEFCGLQHANMGFDVVAQPRADFDAWVDAAAAPATTTMPAVDGENLFLEGTCAGCHAIRGTTADADVGPDLTHLADRETLMAGMLPNTRANLARVVTDPQSIKPGAAMPPTDLSDEELDALLDYLEGLD
jgi:cytochrome c oxidase subunit II